MADMVKTLNGIRKFGGRRGAYRRVSGVDSSGVITPSGSWIDIVYRFKTTIPLRRPKEPVYGEAGEIQVTDIGLKDYSMLISSTQSDKALIDFLIDEGNTGNFLQFFMEFGTLRDGKKFEMVLPLTEISLDTELTFPDPRPEFKVTILENLVAHTLNAVPSWAATTAGSYIVPANRGIFILET